MTATEKLNKIVVTEVEKRAVNCPNCGARRGRPCVSSRIGSANSFGGGWGGYSHLDRAHAERRAEALRERLLSNVRANLARKAAQ